MRKIILLIFTLSLLPAISLQAATKVQKNIIKTTKAAVTVKKTVQATSTQKLADTAPLFRKIEIKINNLFDLIDLFKILDKTVGIDKADKDLILDKTSRITAIINNANNDKGNYLSVVKKTTNASEMNSHVAYLNQLILTLDNQITTYNTEYTQTKNTVQTHITEKLLADLAKSRSGYTTGPSFYTSYYGLTRNKGVVSFYPAGCDYFIVESSLGYSLMQHYYGFDPYEGDTVYGDLNSYSFKDLTTSSGNSIRVWIDDYMLSKSRALEKYYSKCR